MNRLERLVEQGFGASPRVRYVAAYLHGVLALRSRSDLQQLGSNESDRYEEIIVNPTLLTLLTQRGNIDCGGLDHVIIRYGHFHALVIPVQGGHVTVSLEPDASLDEEIPVVRVAIDEALAGLA